MTLVSDILSLIQASSPKPPESYTTEEKSKHIIFKNSQDALAALFHAIMVSFEFRLVDFGEEDNLNGNFDRDGEGNIITLPDIWNAQGPEIYAFRYKHHQSSLTFLIKCMKMANKFLVHGMAIEDNKTTTLEIMTDDYVYPSIFPYTHEKLESQQLLNVYISESRISNLIDQYKANIIDKLIPNLYSGKGGHATTTTISSTTRPDTSNANDPLRIPTRQPFSHFRPPIYGSDGVTNPFSVGQDDLDPIIGPRYGGGIGIGGPSQGGGMYVGPDHPIFGQRGLNRGGFHGGPPTLPRGSVPPGARFDPIVPFGPQPLPRPGRPRGDGNFFSGEPDNDELPPPGYNDMFM